MKGRNLIVASGDWDPAPWVAACKHLFPDRGIHQASPDGLAHAPAEALAAIGYLLAWKPNPRIYTQLPSLEVVFSLGAGVDHLLHSPPPAHLPIVRIVDEDLTGRMVEYIAWQVLDHHRRGPVYRRLQAEGRWHERPQPAAGDVTVGILGLGEIGTAAARLLQALGFKLRGWSRRHKTIDGVDGFSGGDQLDAFLGGTDILVSLLPATPATRGILCYELFGKLRRDGPLPGPVVINAGRGETQVEADLVRALTDGTLAGASLDVFRTEPLPASSPLWRMANLTVTPHVAGVSEPVRLSANIARQIIAHESGKPLHNVIDPLRGY